MNKYRLHNISPVLILLVIAILTYWQASFMYWSFKWDMLDVVLPWRYHIGECLQNGIFPFWNPYQQTGYPIHADLQCPAWYPVVWIVGSFTGYSVYILHILFILHIFLAGYGMYKLAFYFNGRKTESIIIGTTYMLCGFFVAHGQHFFAIVAASYIPFIIYLYLKLVEQARFSNLFKLSLFTYLLISGGYQTLTILTGYLLLTLFIFFLVRHIKERQNISSFIKFNFFFAFLILLLCSPIIVSLIQISDFTTRFTEGVTLQQIQKHPFTPQSLISLLFPFATTASVDFFGTDPSMRNIYIGLPALVFLILSLSKRKKALEWLFLGFGLVCLLASLGSYTPVRKFLADFFPLMHQFKTPSYLTLFFILSILISMSIHLPEIIDSLKASRKRFLAIAGMIAGIIIISNLLFYLYTGSDIQGVLKSADINEIAIKLTLFDRIFIQSIIQLTFLIALILLIYKPVKKELLKRFVFLLVFMDLFISTNANSYFTTFMNYSPHNLHYDISKHPGGFPIPHNEKIIETTDKSMAEWPLWRNLGNFQKRTSFDCFSSLLFSNYIYLLDKQPVLKDSILSNELLYLSDKVFPWDSLSGSHAFSRKDIFVENNVFEEIKSLPFQLSESDSIYIEKYNPNKIELTLHNQHHVVLTFLQEHYTGWNIYINGQKGEFFNSNSLYMSSPVEPGKHHIVIKYSNDIVLIGAIVTAILLSLLLLYLSVFCYKSGNPNFILSTLGLTAFLLATTLFTCRSINQHKPGTDSNRFYTKLIETIQSFPSDSVAIILNTDSRNESLIENYHTKYFRFKIPPDFNEFSKYVKSQSRPYLIFGHLNSYTPPEIRYWILDKFPCKAVSYTINENEIIVYKNVPQCDKEPYFLKIENGFEDESDCWGANEKNLDSTRVYQGNFSYRLDSNVMYSPTYFSTYKDLAIEEPGKMTVDCSLYIYLTDGSIPFIVFSNPSKKKSDIWKAYNIRTHHDINNEWIKVRYSMKIPKGYPSRDPFKIYIWNQSKSACYIDQLQINFDVN